MSRYQQIINSLGGYHIASLSGETSEAVTEDMITQFEIQIETAFQSNYRDFLQHYGGYAFDRLVCYPYLEPFYGGKEGSLDLFFGLIDDENYGLLNNWNIYKGRMPSNLLPIATDPGGNIICLSLDKETQEAIYFWDHSEEGIDNKSPRYSNIYLVANSFDEFMNSLHCLV
jgi:SMI1-KNR4 cell-wall